jgi:hypothetical protein
MDTIVEVDEFTAAVPIPEDLVDGVSATTVVQGLQALSNRTRNLHGRAPLHVYRAVAGDDETAGSCDTSPMTLIKAITTSSYAVVTGLEVVIPRLDLAQNDILEIECSFTAENTGIDGSSDGHRFFVDCVGDKTIADGAGYCPAGCFTHIDVASGKKQHVTFRGRLVVPWIPASETEDASVRLVGRTLTGTAETCNVRGGAYLTVRVYR